MRISGAVRLAAVIAVVASIGACTNSAQTATSSSYARPSIAGNLAVPSRVSIGGAFADVTLNAVDYAPTGVADGKEYAVAEVTIVGRSARPFHYDPGDFFFQYAAGADPYHPDDSSIWSVEASDWHVFVPALRAGYVRLGREVRGNVTFRVRPKSLLLIGLIGDNLTTILEWLTDAP